jgi:glutamate formiminotransferase/formiminotetrahydrofolate cyclodeaminase
VAAIVGALAAALGEMVVSLTPSSQTGAEAEKTLATALATLRVQRQRLTAAAEADERAYAAYRAAASLPRGDADAKRTRTQAMQAALVLATDVPLDVAEAAAATAETLITVAQQGNPHLRSDAALGALLAEAALRGALLNVRGNAGMLRDPERAAHYLAAAERLETTGRNAAERAFMLATERT